ncbi:hypothetical protein C2I27_04085 [Priestia megaterium]|uniref:hypothetical protein n=1 Tax=Priestia megaterium TaxID=1404 RepID=UPI000D51A1F6|nr:hypothetical protein [Priestia megaterium]PVC75072.1 hypothetical protein C2I27_04085 [Priestia megaterium]
MIDINHILEWKQTFGDIYQMEILGQHFIFRALGREEYKNIIMHDLSLGEFQEAICFSSIIYPDDYDYTKGIAGVAEVLSDGILDVSGLLLGQAKELLDEYRQELSNYDYQVDCLIHEAFPEYRLEEIALWPVRKTMYYLSRSEWILQNLKGIPLQLIDETMQQELQEEIQRNQQPSQRPQQPMEMPPEFAEQLPPQPPQQLATNEQVATDFFGGAEKKPDPKPVPEGGIQSEEEVLAMLAGTGMSVAKPSTNMNDIKPELNWFGYMDELKGEFD